MQPLQKVIEGAIVWHIFQLDVKFKLEVLIMHILKLAQLPRSLRIRF